MRQIYQCVFFAVMCVLILMIGGFIPAAEDSFVQTESEDKTEETTGKTEEERMDAPGIPVPERPAGECSSKEIGFYWAPSSNTEYYEIQWKNDSGEQGTLQRKSSDWTCQSGRCILYTELPGDGSYVWTVSAVNDAGTVISEEMNFTLRAGLASPDAYRPASVLSNTNRITFEWQDTRDGAEIFRIQAMDNTNGRIYLDQWYDKTDMFIGNGVCSKPTNVFLPTGNYSWRVKAKNNDSESDWSGWRNFSVACSDCLSGNYLNTTTAVLYPVGMTLDLSPHFEWRAVTGAVSYLLKVTAEDGTELVNVQVPSSNCTIEVCSYKPDLTAAVGSKYVWSVSTYGGNNGFWGSAESSFQTASPSGMEEISFIGPEDGGTLDPENQQIIWTDPGEETVSFVLGITDDKDETLYLGNLTRRDAWCDGLTCSIQFRTIPEGDNYQIVLIPYSEFNIAGKTISMIFSVGSGDEQANEIQ